MLEGPSEVMWIAGGGVMKVMCCRGGVRMNGRSGVSGGGKCNTSVMIDHAVD